MTLSIEDAKTLATFTSAIAIPFAVIWLQKANWSAQVKFSIAVLLSLVTGGLTAYVAGQVVLSGSLIQNAAVIFSAAQIVYYGAFRTLGLERVLFPQEAVTNQAKDQVSVQTANITKKQAQDILDPNKDSTMSVEVTVKS